MDLAGIVDDELLQPLRGAIVGDNLIATGQLRDSVRMESEKTDVKETVRIFAESYILELRDGEQYKNQTTLQDIEIWLSAKGLDGILDAHAVLATIKTEGTTWDRRGGSSKLQGVLNKENIQRIMKIAIEETTKKIKETKWQLR
jgi:hypothetical protein